MNTMEPKQVGIVGAGISGLLACKYTLSRGLTPIVFESRDDVGGVWEKTIETTELQSPKRYYQFSDFPWPVSVGEKFPSQRQVQDYVKAYATHFDLAKHIKFGAKVLSIEFEGASEDEIRCWNPWSGNGEPFGSSAHAKQPKWKLAVQESKNGGQGLSNRVYSVDFVILCIGRFSDVPNIPEFPPNKGPEVFRGQVIHSSDYSAMDYKSAAKLINGKKVIVVGFQKSGIDIAMECSNANGVENPCTLLYRTEHWNLPWAFRLVNLYHNRFSELLVHKPGEGFLLSLLATILSPLRWGLSKFVESNIKRNLPLEKYGLVPKHSFHQDANSCTVSVVPEKFFDKVDEGSIVLKKASSFGFCEDGVLVSGATTPRSANLVILATGFRGDKKLKDIFVSTTFQDYMFGQPNHTVPLYRGCIHPRIPNLAVIGFSESYSNLYTSEMSCRWLAELLAGTFKLPSVAEMERDVERWDEYMKRYSGRNYRRSCIGALHIWYNDQLCKDMGWNPRRKKGFIADLFQPYGPTDYVSSN